MPANTATAPLPTAATPTRKAATVPEKKYKCQYCNRAFSRSEHRSRHERSHTKERPFRCQKCKSTFVRRDLLLRHDRTVHAKDGGIPLHSEVKRRTAAPKTSPKVGPAKRSIELDTATLEQIEASSDGMVDLERAAMLITDLHHKATAAMANQDDAVDEPATPYSPDHATMFDTSVPFLSSAVPLPQMPWESFMTQSVIEPKAHSISSSLSGSQDSQLSQLSFPSASTVHPNSNLLPPMLDERYRDTLAPSLQGLSANMPLSEPSTPNGLSPFPFMHEGPVSPVDYRRSPGPSQPLSLPKAPQIQSDEEYDIIHETMSKCDAETGTQVSSHFQTRGDINSCLSAYFNLFHHHLPFLHPESFKPSEVSAPLLLAVLSIGALYTFDQDKAYVLHIGSKLLVSQFLQNKETFSSRKCPLWTMQSTLLNMIFASWSGDPKGLEWSCSIKSLLANMVAGNQYELKLRTDAREGTMPTQEEWIEDEGCRRTYYAVYIFFGMLTMTYNHTPAIRSNEFDSLELPSSESLWNLKASDEELWRDNWTASRIITVRQAHDRLVQDDPVTYSAFATRVMINALFLEVWSHIRNFEALQDIVTEYKLRLALETWEKSLDLCEPETMVVELSPPHKGHPLIFNAMAVYRNTRARLEVDLKHVQEALRYHDSYEVAAAMSAARDKVKRSPEMLKVIQECFNCIEVVAVHGIKHIGRTCAKNWSVEHPLSGLELMVILSLWLYRIENDDEQATDGEFAMYNKVRNLLDDDTADVGQGSRLSSTVARLWGNLIDEVVVWGITKLMGESFKLLAQALVGYEDAVESQGLIGYEEEEVCGSGSTATTSTTSSQGVDLDMEASV